MKKVTIPFTHHDGGRLAFSPDETNDCVVRALAIAADIHYAQAHAILKDHGRNDRRATYKFVSLMRRLVITGVGRMRVRESGDYGITVRRFVEAHRHGRYILSVREHAHAVVDGVVLDLYLKPRAIVRSAWRFEEINP